MPFQATNGNVQPSSNEVVVLLYLPVGFINVPKNGAVVIQGSALFLLELPAGSMGSIFEIKT